MSMQPYETSAPQLFLRAQDAWDAMYEDCVRATTSIDFEQYVLMADQAGTRFLALFVKKAQEGLRVRLLLDGVGSRMLIFSDYIDRLRQAGGEVRFYNSVSWRHLVSFSDILPRNHVKTLLIDDSIAYTGSVCIWEVMRDWHEMHVRIGGAGAQSITKSIGQLWRCTVPKDCPSPPTSSGPVWRYIVSEPRFRQISLYHELIRRVHAAQKSIRLVTPYFLPPPRLRRALEKAAARGVIVEVLMSAKSDVGLADCVSHSYFPRLLRKGIRIFLFDSGMLHAKYMMIDGTWATVGSTNVDYLSLLRNREANLMTSDTEIIAEFVKVSDDYIRRSLRVDDEYYRGLPLLHRLFGRLGRFIRGVL